MFQLKAWIDRHRDEIFREIQDERERSIMCYSIAKLYFQAHQYELANNYVSEYLKVKKDSASAHKLLGQSYEALGRKELALEEYRQSLQFDVRQNDLIFKIYDLLVNDNTSADTSTIQYLVERTDSSSHSDRTNVNVFSEVFVNCNSKITDDDTEDIKWWNRSQKTSQDYLVPEATAETEAINTANVPNTPPGFDVSNIENVPVKMGKYTIHVSNKIIDRDTGFCRLEPKLVDGIYKCNSCKYENRGKQIFIDHVITKHWQGYYSCPYCKKKLSSRYSVDRHIYTKTCRNNKILKKKKSSKNPIKRLKKN